MAKFKYGDLVRFQGRATMVIIDPDRTIFGEGFTGIVIEGETPNKGSGARPRANRGEPVPANAWYGTYDYPGYELVVG